MCSIGAAAVVALAVGLRLGHANAQVCRKRHLCKRQAPTPGPEGQMVTAQHGGNRDVLESVSCKNRRCQQNIPAAMRQ